MLLLLWQPHAHTYCRLRACQRLFPQVPAGSPGVFQDFRPRVVAALLLGVQAPPLCNVPPAPWQGHSPPAAMTPRQTALYLALHRSQLARTEVEIHQIVRALAIALGASRTENGTIRALHAVLIQMGRPGMSEEEAYRATGASMSNFKKWRKRVQYAQLDLPPPP